MHARLFSYSSSIAGPSSLSLSFFLSFFLSLSLRFYPIPKQKHRINKARVLQFTPFLPFLSFSGTRSRNAAAISVSWNAFNVISGSLSLSLSLFQRRQRKQKKSKKINPVNNNNNNNNNKEERSRAAVASSPNNRQANAVPGRQTNIITRCSGAIRSPFLSQRHKKKQQKPKNKKTTDEFRYDEKKQNKKQKRSTGWKWRGARPIRWRGMRTGVYFCLLAGRVANHRRR